MKHDVLRNVKIKACCPLIKNVKCKNALRKTFIFLEKWFSSFIAIPYSTSEKFELTFNLKLNLIIVIQMSYNIV